MHAHSLARVSHDVWLFTAIPTDPKLQDMVMAGLEAASAESIAQTRKLHPMRVFECAPSTLISCWFSLSSCRSLFDGCERVGPEKNPLMYLWPVG